MTEQQLAAMRQALEAICGSGDFLFNWHDCEPNNEREMQKYQAALAANEKAFIALRTAIEQAETAQGQSAERVEPVAWVDVHDYTNLYYRKPAQVDVVPLYYGPAAPPAAQPVKVWDAEGYDSLVQQLEMLWTEKQRLTALVRAQQITIEKLEAAQPAVPEGWRLVPIEPTPEMLAAADEGDREYTLRNFGDVQTVMQGPYDHYVAMLAAAPAAPVQEPVAYSVGRTLHWHEGKGVNDAQLYTAAPVPFTKAQIERLYRNTTPDSRAESLAAFVRVVRTVEAAHGIKEKNT